MRASSSILIFAALALARTAFPCGLCYEDNRAAVYSYASMQKVEKNREKLEFVVIKIKGPAPVQTVADLHHWLEERKGVDPSTIKISTLQKSIGFVLEKSFPKEELLAALARDFRNLSFKILSYSS